MDTQGPWRIELLGGLRARRGDRLVTRFRTQKTGFLLAYLACHLRTVHPREQLVELLWPECEPVLGRHSLSVALSALRRDLETAERGAGPVILADRLTVALDPAGIATDVGELGECLTALRGATDTAGVEAALNRALALYRGPLLPGCYLEWSLLEQEHLEERFYHALLHAIARLEAQGNLAGAVRCGREAVRIAPLREEAHRELIRLLLIAGAPEEASRHYQRLRRQLRQELDAAPSPATLELVGPLPALPPDPGSPSARDAGRRSHRPAARRPPRPRSAAALPLPLTRFFGREAEIDRLMAMLLPTADATPTPNAALPDGGATASLTRLVTLTGLPGSGKTRLAIEAVRRLATRYADAVLFVSLENVTDPTTLLDRLRRASGQHRSAEVALFDCVVAALRERAHLLVLDSCENLDAAGGALVRRLLESVPPLKCLATARRPLRLAGEHVLTVAPLPTPSSGAPLEVLRHCPSVQLYLDRARAIHPDLALTPANAAAIAERCRGVEGLPLALELAARWPLAPAFTAPCDGLALPQNPTARDRGGLDRRVGSLDAALHASYQSLSPAAQRLAAALSVFRGGWTIAAAQAVARGAPPAVPSPAPSPAEGAAATTQPGDDFGSALAELAELSLISPEETESGLRYRMLETVRTFAAERRPAGDEAQTADARHAEYFLTLARQAYPELTGPAAGVWHHRLEREYDNLMAALAWLLAAGEAYPAFRLCQALYRFWYFRGYGRAGRDWFVRLLAMPSLTPTCRARALLSAAVLAQQVGDLPRSEAWLTESRDLFRAVGDRAGLANALRALGGLAFRRGDYDRTRALYTASLALRIAAREPVGIAQARSGLGSVAQELGQHVEAREHFQESLRIYEAQGHLDGILSQIRNLGDLARMEGRLGEARALYERALERSHAGGADTLTVALLGRLCQLAARQGDAATALAFAEQRLQVCHRLGNPAEILLALADGAERAARAGRPERARALLEGWGSACHDLRDRQPLAACLDYLAWSAYESSGGRETERAVRLYGAADTMRGCSLEGALAEGTERSRQLHALREALREPAFTQAITAGRALTLDQVAALIVAPAASSGAPPTATARRDQRRARSHPPAAAPEQTGRATADPAILAAIRERFAAYHATFAPLFGRRDRQERSRDYLRALLAGPRDRAGSARLARAVGAPARSLQRFLVEAPWDAAAVIARLPPLLAPVLADAAAVWRIFEIGYPRRALRTVGVARQYCPSLGKVTECQIGLFLGCAGPAGVTVLDGTLYLPPEWTGDEERCWAAAVPETARCQSTKAAHALALLQRVPHPPGPAGRPLRVTRELGEDPTLCRAATAAGYRLEPVGPDGAVPKDLLLPAPASQVHTWSGWHRAMTMEILAAAFPLFLTREPLLAASLPLALTDRHRLIASALSAIPDTAPRGAPSSQPDRGLAPAATEIR